MINLCVRCGKQRIDSKTWKSKVGASIVVHVMTVCPDKVCQKLVEEGIADRRAKSDQMNQEKARAKLDREKRLAEVRLIRQ